MHIHISIICLTDEIPVMKHRLTQLIALMCNDVTDNSISPYWKASQCSCIILDSIVNSVDIQQLKHEVAVISGGTSVSENSQNGGIELSCYTPLADILSGDNKAFVTCYVQD